MYRAKVEAISGTKVYAGGKWLRCIGNKSVRVGEIVWTDGRCVYGHNQISQQPLIVTAPAEDDEGIPIIVSNQSLRLWFEEPDKGLYTYKNNKLKFIRTIDDKNGMMINNKNHVYYTDTPTVSLGENRYKRLLATNINEDGMRFDIATIYDVDSGYIEYAENEILEICKNGKVIQSFDLSTLFIDNFWSKIPALPTNVPFSMIVFTEYDVKNVFIEDENNWSFLFLCWGSKSFGLDDYIGPYPSSGLDPNASTPDRMTWYSLNQWQLFTANDCKTIYKKFQYQIAENPAEEDESYPDLESTKFALQDGYYFTMRPVNDRDVDYGWFYQDFYDKKGRYIFTLMNHPVTFDPNYVLKKIQGGYLLGSQSDFLTDDPDDDLGFPPGLYLYKNNKWTQLIKGVVTNQRLRAMTKTKNWQNRIKELTVIE